MEKLQHEEKKQKAKGQMFLSEFISTHPPALERAVLIILNLKDAKKIYNDACVQRRNMYQRGVMLWAFKVIGYDK